MEIESPKKLVKYINSVILGKKIGQVGKKSQENIQGRILQIQARHLFGTKNLTLFKFI